MIPIRDTQTAGSVAVVTRALIAVNVVVFLVQLTQGEAILRFNYFYGLVPARYTVERIAAHFSFGQQVFALLSFMFLHGGFLHLLGNMWSLYIFGDNVEDHLGPFRFLAFYLLCGLVSGLTHMLSNPMSNIPTVGASGAIAGVMGGYFLLFPSARVLTLVPIVFIPLFFEIPAFVFIGVWFLLQVLNATGGGQSAIAWWAHIGGFVAGMLLVRLSDRLPASGLSRRVKPLTAKRHTERLQVIRPAGEPDDPNLYGTVRITELEARRGATKLVNVPWGFHKRLLRVTVPPGISEGSRLRLRGLGRWTPDGHRGDLYLQVVYER
ncbi:MAG TPA: rhomboid family intramembrane serine protease [Desulfobacteraceae bacterium]|nr:rhomboid family intramembrane serine protease [Desulfobacteraceae bacterium]